MTPAYTRLGVEERRRRLLALGADLFTRRAYDEVSMAQVARAAGISKALLYHYFPSKRAFFTATLQEKAAELAERTRVDPARPPAEQIAAALEAFLAWVEENDRAYAKLVRSAGIPEVGEVVREVREATAQRIVEALGGGAPLRGAVRAWLWFLDGAILDWLEHRDVTREQVRDVALGALAGAAGAAGARLGG